MAITPIPTLTTTPLARFPTGHFLENLAVRSDGSILITAVLQQQLWYVPTTDATVHPLLVHTFDHPVTGIAEVEPDVFVISLTEAYDTHEAHLTRIDLAGWTPGDPVTPELIHTFTDDRVQALNGSCLLGPGVLALADCFAGLIWRVDLSPGAHHAVTRLWCAHDTMTDDPDSGVAPPRQPGVNGLAYSPRTGFLYYTSTAQKVFMRVAVDPATLEPADTPEFVAAISDADDFCLDDRAGFAYVTRHRANTLDRVPLTPGHGSEVRHLLGSPLDRAIVGPSSAAWARDPDRSARSLLVITDGGTTAPPPDGAGPAMLLRVELADEQTQQPVWPSA